MCLLFLVGYWSRKGSQGSNVGCATAAAKALPSGVLAMYSIARRNQRSGRVLGSRKKEPPYLVPRFGSHPPLHLGSQWQIPARRKAVFSPIIALSTVISGVPPQLPLRPRPRQGCQGRGPWRTKMSPRARAHKH